MNSNSKALLAEQKKKYRVRARNLPLAERLRNLEELQEQSYEILRIREANGGPPIPEDWQRWAKGQEELEK
ncbi:MAG: hypothetical protein HOP17_00550 [Acidobacteria bacterium]|nr:hypothetical protein [Acidobacteriota bacterium]